MFRTVMVVVFLSILLVAAGRRERPAGRHLKSSLRSLFKYAEGDDDLLTPIRNIFGPDDRTPMLSTAYPWRAIGKLSTGCTGTLVGRNLVLTAAHCIIDPNTRTMYNYAIYFYADMINGATSIQARVTSARWGTNDPDRYRENDWALLRLDKNLGESQGWFATRQVPLATMKATPGTLVGYSSDYRNGQTAGVFQNCKMIAEYQTNMFLHDCDATRGSSGGPIFAYWNNVPTVYVLNVGEFRNGGDTSLRLPAYLQDNANIAIWSTELQNEISKMSTS